MNGINNHSNNSNGSENNTVNGNGNLTITINNVNNILMGKFIDIIIFRNDFIK